MIRSCGNPHASASWVERIVAASGQAPVDGHQVPHPGHLRRHDDPVMRQPARLGQLGGAEGALDHGGHRDVLRVLRFRRLRIGVHHLGQQLLIETAPVHADADRFPVGDGDFDDVAEMIVAALGADVAGIDAVLGESGGTLRILGEQQVAVVVEVPDHGDVHLCHDVRHRLRRGVVIDGHPDQLRPRLVECADLRHRRAHVGGVGVRHGLDDDRVGGPDPHAAYHGGDRFPSNDVTHAGNLTRTAARY